MAYHPDFESYAAGVATSMNSIGYYKSLLNEWLVTGNQEKLESYVLYTENPPALMCSGVLFPEETPSGIELQQLWRPDIVPDLLSITSYHDKKKGIVALSWCKQKARASELLIESIDVLTDRELSTAITKLIFAHCENVYLSPSWWDALDSHDRMELERLMFPSDQMPRTANPRTYLKIEIEVELS